MTDRIQSEFVSFGMSKEATYGTTPTTGWEYFEPDVISQFGNEYVFERRDPFNVDRLMRKPTLTGYSAMFGMEGDATDWHLNRMMPMMLLADWQGELPEYTVATVTAAGFTLSAQDYASLVEVGTLIEVLENDDGLTEGRFRVKKGSGNAITEMIPISESKTQGRERMIAEGTAVAGQTLKGSSVTAKIRVIGIALVGAAGKAVTLSKSKVSQAGSGKMQYNTPGSGLTESGKGIFITVRDDVVEAKREAAKKHIGFARLSGRGEGFLDYERSEGETAADIALTAAATGTVYIFISKWIKNVPADDPKWNIDSWSIAGKYLGLKNAGADDPVYEVIRGCHMNAMSLRFGQQSRIRMSADWMGQAKLTRSRASAAPWSTEPTSPTAKEAIATSVDIGRANLIDIGDSPANIITLMQSLDLNFTNNIEGDYVLDNPGSIGPQIGKFGLNATMTSLIAARRMFEVVEQVVPASLQVACGNGEGWWMFDIPRMTLVGDRKNFERNKSMKLEFSVEYEPDETYSTAMIVSRFPWLPITRRTLA